MHRLTCLQLPRVLHTLHNSQDATSNHALCPDGFHGCCLASPTQASTSARSQSRSNKCLQVHGLHNLTRGISNGSVIMFRLRPIGRRMPFRLHCCSCRRHARHRHDKVLLCSTPSNDFLELLDGNEYLWTQLSRDHLLKHMGQ